MTEAPGAEQKFVPGRPPSPVAAAPVLPSGAVVMAAKQQVPHFVRNDNGLGRVFYESSFSPGFPPSFSPGSGR
jgi:hypothetical protein